MKTDVDKTLQALRKAGSKGIHSFELNYIVGTTRSAARIQDLKDKGYRISSKPEKLGDSWGVRYSIEGDTEKKPNLIFDPDRQVYYYG